jgi:hypothetical protein
MFAFRLALVLTSVVILGGCAKAGVTTMPNGDHRIVCERGMKVCITRADKVCGDDGYTIVSGTTKKHLLGGEGSSYREMAENAELIVSCGDPPPPAEEETKYVALPPRTDQPAPAYAACIPGASQLCVGPAACQGGQVCLADGSGFGACDCGSSAPAAPGAAPAPTPTAPPAPAGGAAAPKPVPGSLPPAEPL